MELPGEYIHRTFLEQEGEDVGEILHDVSCSFLATTVKKLVSFDDF